MAALVEKGNRFLATDQRFQQELKGRMQSDNVSSNDTIPASVLGAGGQQEYISSSAPVPNVEDAPLLIVLGTDTNTTRDWIAAGQALSRVLLRARMDEIGASFLDQAISIAGSWPQLRTITGQNGFPQLLLRMGYIARQNESIPRRSVSAVLDSEEQPSHN